MNHSLFSLPKMMAVLVIACLFCSCEFKNTGFHITGEISHLTEGTKVYLEEMEFNAITALDTATAGKDGKFEMKGFLKHEGLYRLRFGSDKYAILVLSEKQQDISIKGDTTSFVQHPYSIKGSPTSVQLQNFLLTTGDRYKEIRNLFTLINDSIHPVSDSLKKIYQAQVEKKATDARTFIMKYVDTVSDPVIDIFAIYYFLNPRLDLPAFQKLSDKLKQNYPDLPLAKSFNEAVAQIQQQANPPGDRPMFANGKTLPNIEMNDINRKSINLYSLKGRYVLVDFWASWCGPCRAENPNVVKAYNDFKDKGFTVFSISLDDDYEKWTKAIEKDNLSWPFHVSELKGWKSDICQQFGITAIPTNYLIDKEGKVIASDLRGNELENILSQTLK